MTLMAVAVLLTCASERLSCCSGRDAGPERRGGQHRPGGWPEHLKDIGIDIDGFIASDWGGAGWRSFTGWGNIITRLRTGDDAPSAFQQLICMADGHKAHAAADHCSRSDGSRSPQPDAKGDLLGQLLRQLLILSLRPSRTITSIIIYQL